MSDERKPEEQDEKIEDLDVPEEQSEEVKGGYWSALSTQYSAKGEHIKEVKI